MPNIIEEYLIRLGFESDEPSFNKFRNLMADADKQVTEHTSGIVKHMLEAQASIVGAFTSLSAAIIGVVDKVAMADQGYRLLALRMLMTTDSARKMDMITKALGASLAEIVWDPELHGRAVIMAQDIDRMTKGLGPDFERKMLGIRDLRFEFSRLEVAMKFLGMNFASSLFSRLGLGDVGARLKGFVDWFEQSIPQIADKLARYAIPILKETWTIFKDIGGVLKGAATAFTSFVGLLSGDTSIVTAEANFDNIATAVQHVSHAFETLLHWITEAELLLAHFANAASLALSGKFDQAANEFKRGLNELTVGSGAAIGSVFGPWGAAIGGLTGSIANLGRQYGVIGPPTVGTEPRGAREVFREDTRQPAGRSTIEAAVAEAAGRFGIPRELALAVAKHESGFNPNATNRNANGTTDWGVMQLNDKTIQTLGVRNPLDARENIEAGVGLLARLFDKYHGDQMKVLSAYSAGEGRVDRSRSFEDMPAITRKAVPEILQIEQQYMRRPTAAGAMVSYTNAYNEPRTQRQTGAPASPVEGIEKPASSVDLLNSIENDRRTWQNLKDKFTSQGAGRKVSDIWDILKTGLPFTSSRPSEGNALAKLLAAAGTRPFGIVRDFFKAGFGSDLLRSEWWDWHNFGGQADAVKTKGGLAGGNVDALRAERAAALKKWQDIRSGRTPSPDSGRSQVFESESKFIPFKPAWFDGTPRFMQESPVWYGIAPKWLTETPEGDTPKIAEIPSGLPAWMMSPLLPLPADMQPQARLFREAQRPPVPAPQNHQHTTTVDYGGVQIYVTEPGASVHQIRRVVVEELDSHAKRQIQTDLSQLSPLF